jgi:hypothetical protein
MIQLGNLTDGEEVVKSGGLLKPGVLGRFGPVWGREVLREQFRTLLPRVFTAKYAKHLRNKRNPDAADAAYGADGAVADFGLRIGRETPMVMAAPRRQMCSVRGGAV